MKMQGDWWVSSKANPEPAANQQRVPISGPVVSTPVVHPRLVVVPSCSDNLESVNPQVSGSCFRPGLHVQAAATAVTTGHQRQRHPICSQNSFGVASSGSTSNLILAAAQRRKKMYFNQPKTVSLLHSSKKLGFSSHTDIGEKDLTWTSFFKHCRINRSSNSAYSSQEGGQGGPQTTAQSGQTGGQVTSGNGLGLGIGLGQGIGQGLGQGAGQGVGPQMSSDDLKHLKRKLEREREKRIHADPNAGRLDSRVGGENGQPCDFNMRRNGFRPTSKNTFMSRGADQHPSAPFRHTHAPAPAPSDPLTSLSITNVGTVGGAPPPSSSSSGGPGGPGMLRGQSIGFGSREGLATSGLNGNSGGGGVTGTLGRTGKSRTRFLANQSDKYRQNQYQFPDPAAGSPPDFQQRLSELTSLESDTVRYERSKKVKRKSKQDSG